MPSLFCLLHFLSGPTPICHWFLELCIHFCFWVFQSLPFSLVGTFWLALSLGLASHFLSLPTILPTALPHSHTPLPAACSPWATWPCSGSSASSSRAWLRGLCCCSTSCSTTGGGGGQAEARGKSPGMGRSGFTRSGICGLMLGGCQFPSAILDSSPCRREAENQPMMWASDPIFL